MKQKPSTNITTDKQRSVSRGVSDSNLYNAINANVSRQIQMAMSTNLNVASRAQQFQQARQSSINLTPQFEGTVNMVFEDKTVVKKHVKFVDKEFSRRARVMAYGDI